MSRVPTNGPQLPTHSPVPLGSRLTKPHTAAIYLAITYDIIRRAISWWRSAGGLNQHLPPLGSMRCSYTGWSTCRNQHFLLLGSMSCTYTGWSTAKTLPPTKDCVVNGRLCVNETVPSTERPRADQARCSARDTSTPLCNAREYLKACPQMPCKM